MKIKICGITNYEDAKICSDLGADALGFIFYKGSKRYINPSDAISIIKLLPAFIVKVGVFVNEDINYVNSISSYLKLNMIQLHGNENIKYCDSIKLPTIKSFGINDGFNFEILEQFLEHYILLDKYDAENFGGTGKNFNWGLIPRNILENIILSGGITSSNITNIFNDIKPSAVDLSSSVEVSPGKKDKEKLIDFFSIANSLRRK